MVVPRPVLPVFPHNHFIMPAALAPCELSPEPCTRNGPDPSFCIRESRSQRGLLIISAGIIAIKVDGIYDIKINR